MNRSCVFIWAPELLNFLADFVSEVNAGVIDLLYDASVPLVLSCGDPIFGVFLVFRNGLCDLGFFLVHSLLEELLGVVKELN